MNVTVFFNSILKPSLFALCLFLLNSCGSDSCKSYSDFTCSQLENSDYNVYFWFPDNDKEYFLGRSTSLSMCGSMARNYAYEKNVTYEDWDYICCLNTDGSSCKEKHR